MYKNILGVALVILSLISCADKKEQASIKFIFEEPENDEIYLSINKVGSLELYSSITTDKDEVLFFKKEGPRYLYIHTNKFKYTNIYLEPGKQLVVRYKNDKLFFEGELAPEANFLNKGAQRSKEALFSKVWLRNKNKELKNKLQGLRDADLPVSFKEIEEQRIMLGHYNGLVTSPSNLSMFAKDKYQLCEGYYGFLEHVKFDSKALVKVPGWYKPVFDIFSQMEKNGLIDADVDNFLYAHANRIVDKDLKEEYVLAGLSFLLKHDYRDNIDEIAQNGFRVLKSEASQKRYYHIMDQFAPLKEKYKSISKGNLAKDFSGLTPKGKVNKLSEYKGKVVLIDVWNQGCAPCKYEMPYLKLLKEAIHHEDFVCLTLSLDNEKNIEKWKQYIVDHDLIGVQLNDSKAFKSLVVKDYLISGIPKYIIVDREGKIVDAFARRPSDPKLKKQLMDVLLGNAQSK